MNNFATQKLCMAKVFDVGLGQVLAFISMNQHGEPVFCLNIYHEDGNLYVKVPSSILNGQLPEGYQDWMSYHRRCLEITDKETAEQIYLECSPDMVPQ